MSAARMGGPRRCAYCGSGGPFTREHIWPAGFLRRYRPELSYSRRAAATFRGDLTVKDVCGDCNNGVLSELDGYACELYDRYFQHRVGPRETIDFRYDHGLLTRWLLKLSFNSARATGEDAPALAPYASTIIADAPVSPCFCGVWIDTVKAATRPPRPGMAFRVQQARGYRCAQIHLADVAVRATLCLRLVMVNAFRFTIAVSHDTRLSPGDEAILRRVRGAIVLQPGGAVVIPPPRMDVHAAWAGVEDWPAPR